DRLNNRFVIWTRPKATSRQWSYSAQFGTSGSGDTNFFYPDGIFVSADGLTAWVADAENSRIVIWTRPKATSRQWSYSTQFGTYGSGDTNFDSPSGIVVSPDTLTAWVGDNGNNRIAIWTRRTATSTVWRYSAQFGTAGSGAGNLASPSGIAVAADARTVWTADTGDNRISVWTQR
ncbi:MAG: NHL repeat-containing protein, partial [Chloroflexota bacterium]